MMLAEDTDPRVVASVAYSEGFKEEASLDQLKKIMEKKMSKRFRTSLLIVEVSAKLAWMRLHKPSKI